MKRIITSLAIMAFACPSGHAMVLLTPDQQEQLKIKSGTWLLQTQKADALVKAGKDDEAIAIYHSMMDERQALSGRDTDLMPSYDAIAAIYMKRGKFEEALKVYKDMVANREDVFGPEDPTVAYPLQQLAACLTKLGKKDEAKAALARANAITKAVESMPTFGKITGAVGSPERIAEGEKMRALGEKFMKLDHPEKGLVYFNRAVLLNPKDALAMVERGQAAEFKDQNAKALADYDAAIKLQPDLRQAYVARANWHAQQRQNKAAIGDYDKARELDPKDEESMGQRAKLLDEMGQHKAAVEGYTEIIAAHPDLYWPYAQRAVAYTSLGEHKKAVDDFSVLVKRAPDDYDFYESRAKAYLKGGDLQNALTDYDKVIELNPKYSIGYHERGKIYEKLDGKKSARAIADYTAAKKLGYTD